VQADLAHIKGEKPGAARYDPSQSDDERRAFENIILVCPNHHRRIDLLEPAAHPVHLLHEMKQQHEEACRGADWASEAELDRYVLLLLTREPSPPPAVNSPKLRIERGPGESYEVVNFGDADAYDPKILLADDAAVDAVILTGQGVTQLSPHGRWGAFVYAPSLADSGPHMVTLMWTDGDGHTYNGSFPVG
jgi:hypothetical protein